MGYKKHYKRGELIEYLRGRITYIETLITYLKEAERAEAEQYPQLDGAELARLVKLMYVYIQNQTEVGEWCYTHIAGFSSSKSAATARAVAIIDNEQSTDKALDGICKKVRDYARDAAEKIFL